MQIEISEPALRDAVRSAHKIRLVEENPGAHSGRVSPKDAYFAGFIAGLKALELYDEHGDRCRLNPSDADLIGTHLDSWLEAYARGAWQ